MHTGATITPIGTKNGETDGRTYDNDDSMTQTQTAKSASVYGTFTYTRDPASQLASTATSGANLAPGGTESYGYNSLQQLSGTSGASSLTYGYDHGDNPTRLNSAYQAFDSADELCWQNTTSSANPCGTPPTGATTYAYDAEGNRHTQTVASTTTTYTYDQQNRLSSVSGGATASYTYMADGTRISKTTGGVTTNFTYSNDGGTPRLLLTSGGGVTTKFPYGPDGNVFEQKVGTPTTYLSDDQLGSVRIVTDNTGNDVGTYNYDPYGNPTSHTGTTSALQYAGQYLDTETGFYYLQARYYDPTTSQFTTRDPAYDTTLDPYGYINNSPLNGTDPNGLIGISLGPIHISVDCPLGKNPNGSCRGTGVVKHAAKTLRTVATNTGNAVGSTSRFVADHYGQIATRGAILYCLTPGVGWVSCGIAGAGAWLARSAQRAQTEGISNSLGDDFADAGLTYVSWGLGGALEYAAEGQGALGWLTRLIPAGYDTTTLYADSQTGRWYSDPPNQCADE
ncbi:MAG TPA: RHS repeat-associated core domain-containing protein [Acidimicrobiia bacterium]